MQTPGTLLSEFTTTKHLEPFLPEEQKESPKVKAYEHQENAYEHTVNEYEKLYPPEVKLESFSVSESSLQEESTIEYLKKPQIQPLQIFNSRTRPHNNTD